MDMQTPLIIIKVENLDASFSISEDFAAIHFGIEYQIFGSLVEVIPRSVQKWYSLSRARFTCDIWVKFFLFIDKNLKIQV